MDSCKYIVFSDFDGTITSFETAEGLWSFLLGEDVLRAQMQRFLHEKVNLSTAIKYMFHLIPSEHYPEILRYLETIEIRSGFPEFVDFLYSEQIPLVIVSGGIREIVEGTLKPYRDKITDCYSIDLSTESPYMTVSSPYDDGVDMIRKELVMQKYSYNRSIFIGDSYTDIHASQTADIIFARDRLGQYLSEQKIPHHSFHTFHDIIKTMKEESISNRS